jgi:hypothetical protein
MGLLIWRWKASMKMVIIRSPGVRLTTGVVIEALNGKTLVRMHGKRK